MLWWSKTIVSIFLSFKYFIESWEFEPQSKNITKFGFWVSDNLIINFLFAPYPSLNLSGI